MVIIPKALTVQQNNTNEKKGEFPKQCCPELIKRRNWWFGVDGEDFMELVRPECDWEDWGGFL